MQGPSAVEVSARMTPAEQPRRARRGGSGFLALARARRASLLWRVFAGNAMVLVAAAAAIAFSRVTIHASIRLSELAAVVAGLVVMLAVDLLLLRRSLGPLRRLARLMSEVDPQRPGRRAEGVEYTGSEVIDVAEAFNAMLDRLETERLASTRRALGAQEEERRWVARELHDEVGQTLTAVALKAARAAKEGGVQAGTMSEIAASLQQSLIEVRRMARRLRPEALDDLGLVNAMIAMCRRIGDHGALRVDVDFASDLPQLGVETDLVIYRVAQEALTNARRHAQASTVTVALARDAAHVVLTVCDDGHGLLEPVGESNGLAGMRERALMIGAQLDVCSRAGQGVGIRLSVPLLAGDHRCPPR
jgi:two-component system sensor histidine kinase UhpB